MQITTIGLDIAKNVLQVHGIDGDEKIVVGLKRTPCAEAEPSREYVAMRRRITL